MPGLLMDWDGRRVYVDQPELLFGRHGSIDLQTDNPAVGRRQARFSREGDAWFVEDTGSPGGTYLDDRRVTGRQPLAVGQRLRCGGARFTVLDLAHAPAPDEVTGGLRTDEVFAARGVTAAIGVTIRARDTTGAMRAALAGALAEAHASHDDPVSLVHACAAFEARLAAETTIRAHLARVELDAHALALLREASAPARAAWTWLTQRFQYRALEGAVCGLVYKGLPFEPSPAIVDAAPPGGLLVWVREGPLSHLLHLTASAGIARAPRDGEPGAVVLARVFEDGGAWMLRDLGSQGVAPFPVGASAQISFHTLQRVR